MAEGYLLSGFRIWIPDEQGNPLFEGRVSFFVAGTSTPATVYKDKELTTAWGTSVYTDAQGYLGDHSYGGVWLNQTHLYDCVVEKKIQEDPETWYPMWSIKNVGAIAKDENEYGGTSAIVSNYQALKALSAAKYDYVYVAGWYTPGDTGAPMVFRWVDDADADEDGHWVKPNSVSGNGRWEQMFESGEVDPRKFGAIPNSGHSCDAEIGRAMRYACEPVNYTANEKRAPRTVHFVAGGIYKLLTHMNFSLYKMNALYGGSEVPVIIDDGIVFDGGKVTFGYNTTILANNPIITEDSELDFVEGSMEFVRPQWWDRYDIWSNIYKACATDNDVKVYGVGSQYTSGEGTYTISGKGTLEFLNGMRKVDTSNLNIKFKVLVKADPNLSLIKLPENSAIASSSKIAETKALRPLKFYNDNQVICDGWFGLQEDMYGKNISEYKGILLHWCFNSFFDEDDNERSGTFDVTGGYEVANEGVEPSNISLCNFKNKISIDGCTIKNIYIENGNKQIVECTSGGKIEIKNDVNYVEWFGSIDAAIEGTSDKQTLSMYSSTSAGSITKEEVSCKMRDMIFGLSNFVKFANDVTDCTISCNGNSVQFNYKDINVHDNKFNSADVITLNVPGNANFARFVNNTITFRDLVGKGYVNVICTTDTIPISVIGNNITNNDSTNARIAYGIIGNVKNGNFIVSNNPGSCVDGRGTLKSFGGTISNSNGNLFYLRKMVRDHKLEGGWVETWSTIARIARIGVEVPKNYYNDRVMIDVKYLEVVLLSSFSTSSCLYSSASSTPSSFFISQALDNKVNIDSHMSIRKSSTSEALAGTYYFLMKSDSGTTDADIEPFADWNPSFEFFSFTATNLEGAYVATVTTNTTLE